MKYLKKILAFKDIMKTRYLGKRTPVAIRWQLTNRCTHKCIYCNIWKTPAEEMDADQILMLLDQVAEAGTRRISFSGGDPLLRKDFGQIVRHANSLGISCSINSNGFLIEKKIDDVRHLDLVKLSLDGPREIHESQKGKGSFDRVMHAAKVLKENGVKFTFACTITKYNVDHLNFLQETARKYNTLAAFQPLKEMYRGVEDIEDISPPAENYRIAIQMLIDQKKAGNLHLRNSLRGLRHIRDWPKYERLECGAGKIFCMVQTDGKITPCDRLGYKNPLPSALENGFDWAFDHLPKPKCAGCGFCGSLELNYILNLKFDILPIVNKISS